MFLPKIYITGSISKKLYISAIRWLKEPAYTHLSPCSTGLVSPVEMANIKLVKVMHRRKHKIKQPIIGAYILSLIGNREAKTIHWSKSHRWESSHPKSFSTWISRLLCFDCGFRCLVPCFQYFGVNRIDSYNCSPNHNHMALTNHDYLSLSFRICIENS